MKNIKRMLAILLAVVLLFSFAGCHKKDEIAVKIGDVKFTSAYYMCALMAADGEAKAKVDEQLAEAEEKSEEETETSTEKVDYYSQKIEDKSFSDWTKDRAIEMLKEIAAYKTLCKENELEIDDETKTNVESYASYYWSSYGYAAYYEPNGVGQATYTNFMKDSYYSELYFEHLYGEEGKKALKSDDVKKTIYDNFIIADILEGAFTEEMKDADKENLKKQFDDYAKALNDGKNTFEEVYNEYNKVEEEESHEGHDHEEEAEETEEEEELKPQDELATVLGAEDTGYESEYYEDIKKLDVGKATVLKLDDDAGYVLVIKQDIKKDPYYLDSLDMTARHMIADEDFEKLIADYSKDLTPEINKYAVGQFKVEKIVEPEYGY